MKIVQYSTELSTENLNILVKEKEFDYAVDDSFTTPGKIVDMLNCFFRLDKKAEEYAYMIAFTANMNVLGIFEISHGAVNYSILCPRETYVRALLCGACHIVIAHNHPSGSVTPSEEDKTVYRRLSDAGKLIGIDLIDFIIVGGKSYYSFTEEQ